MCAISKNSVEHFWRSFALNFAMFKLSLAINLPIMEVVPPFEQTIFTQTQGLFVCNI